MTDAEFCSDAHRRSHAEEQDMAMQRLTESPPALQRTQRMAAATPRGIMPVQGEYIPVGPWETDYKTPLSPAEPLASTGRLIFAHREHAFTQSFQRYAVLEPVGYYRARRGDVSATRQAHGTVSSLRIVMPRTAAADPVRGRRWSGVAPAELRALTLAARAGGRTAVATESDWVLTGTERTEWKMTERRARLECQLSPAHRLVTLPLTKAAADQPASVSAESAGFEWDRRVCYPVDRLKAVAPPAPEGIAVADEWDDSWTAVEASPLGALIAATDPANFAPVASPAKPSISARPLAVSELAPLNPASYGAGPAAEFAAPPAGELHPVTVPESRPLNVGLPEFVPAAELATASTQRIPSRDIGFGALRLETPGRVLSIDALEPVPGLHGRLLKAAWKATSLTPTLPAPSLSLDTVRLPNAGIVAVSAPPAVPLEQESQAGTGWLPAVITGRFPGSRTLAAGGGIALGGRVDCDFTPEATDCKSDSVGPNALLASAIAGDYPQIRAAAPGSRLAFCASVPVRWQPGAAKSTRRSLRGESFLPVSRVRLPRRVSEIARGYASAGCVPLNPPQIASLKWEPALANRAELCPPATLPAAFKATRSGVLATLPVKLFAVPDCRPMARPSDGRPVVFGMDEWGNKPLVCPSGLRPSSRRRRRRGSRPESPGLKARLEQWVSGTGIGDVLDKASRLPSDLKWIAMVVPLVIGIWTLTRPSEPEPARPPAQTASQTPEVIPAPPVEEPKTQKAALRSPDITPEPVAPPVVEKASAPAAPVVLTPAMQTGPWGAFTARIAGRASVDLIEDFRNGLSNWDGRGEWARTWSYDRAGTIRPGTLAFFLPSAGLRDYVFELKASIERRAIQWVVRATGPDNYHFARLNVSPGTPLTALELERWSIVNGRAGKVTHKTLPHGGAHQTVYTIRVEAHGDSITTYLQDQVVDTFNDARLPEGGVGLVGAPEDRPRVYGIHVFHQNDFLGKLCSFLAPQPINSQGSD